MSDSENIIIVPPPQPMAKKTKVKEPKVKEPKVKDEPEPKWSDLYFVLSDAGDCFLRHIVKRNDVPEDVIELIRGVLALRETRDMFVAEGDRLTKETAMFWSDRLKGWVESK